MSPEKVELRAHDGPVIAASLLVVVTARRVAFMQAHQRTPTPEEAQAIQAEVISEWATLTAQVEQVARMWGG